MLDKRATGQVARGFDVATSVLTAVWSRPQLTDELCESRGGRPGLPVPNKPDGVCGRKGRAQELPLPLPPSPYPLPPFSPSLISLMVSVHVKHHVYLLSL